MPGSEAMTTSRVSSVLIVGSVSGVVPGLWPKPNIEQAPSELVSSSSASVRGNGASSRRSRLRCMVALLRLGGAVVQLRDRVAGLRGVGGQALLLRHQLDDGDLLQRTLLLLR